MPAGGPNSIMPPLKVTRERQVPHLRHGVVVAGLPLGRMLPELSQRVARPSWLSACISSSRTSIANGVNRTGGSA
jgi:hypothetical protein